MRKWITKIVKAVVFMALLLTILYNVNEALVPKTNHNSVIWAATDKYNQFYKMEENTIDVLFLGSSVVANAISPQQLYDDYGIRSYNLASSGQSIFFNYYWLKEALQYQSPKVVVLDSKFMFEMYPNSALNTTEGTYRECSNFMKWSSNKVEMIDELCKYDKTQDKLSYYLTNLRYHTRWTELEEIDLNYELTSEDQLKGQSLVKTYCYDEYVPFEPVDMEIMADPVPVSDTYLEKIVDLCKENSIQLIFVTYPDTMTDARNNRMNYYSKLYNIPYYNFCLKENYEKIGAKLPKENVVEHENVWGAIKMSQRIGDILQNDYSVPSVYDKQWEETRYYYEHMLSSAELKYIDDFKSYIKGIAGDTDYITFIAVKDDAVRFITDDEVKLLNSVGLYAPFKDMFRYSYIAIINQGEGNVEQISSNEILNIQGNLDEGNVIYDISSGGTNAGLACTINLNGMDYQINGVGFNIVVYDKVTKSVVDSVCFYTAEDGPYCKR